MCTGCVNSYQILTKLDSVTTVSLVDGHSLLLIAHFFKSALNQQNVFNVVYSRIKTDRSARGIKVDNVYIFHHNKVIIILNSYHI